MSTLVADRHDKYVLTVDDSRGLLTAKLYGFWSSADVDDFQGAVGRALPELRRRCERVALLFDATGSQVQSGAILERLHERAPSGRSGMKMAFVVQSSLLRLQIERAQPRSAQVAVFTSPDEAKTWLLA